MGHFCQTDKMKAGMSQAPKVHIKKFFSQARKHVEYYLGKRICYVYRAKTLKNESKFRTMWGKVCRAHGTSGTVRAKFTKNLPPSALGAPVRIMLYPSRV